MKAGMIDRVILAGVLVLLMGAGTLGGEIFEVPLDCAGHYEWMDTWVTEFDLGVEFVIIQNVYIEWSGEITAELGEGFSGGEWPVDGQFVATLYEVPSGEMFGQGYVRGGEATYPAPEPFDVVTEMMAYDWSELLDGIAEIEIGLFRSPQFEPITLEYPFGDIFAASLFIEGQIVPEPTVVLILLGGTIWMRARRSRKGRG